MTRWITAAETHELMRCPLLDGLGQPGVAAILEHVRVRDVLAGAPILKQGARNESLLVLVAGEARLTRSDEGDEREVTSLAPGDHLGERALLGVADGAWATATTTTDCCLAEIPSADFRDYVVPNRQNRVLFDRAIVAPCAPVRALDDDARQRVLNACVEMKVPAGDDIVTQGTPGKSFFVLVDGTVEVVQTQQNGSTVKLTELGPGAYFGEQALLGNAAGLRSATVRAVTPCRVHSIGADVFTAQIAASARNRERFERDASTYVNRELTKSLSAFISSELDETSEGVERRGYSRSRSRSRCASTSTTDPSTT